MTIWIRGRTVRTLGASPMGTTQGSRREHFRVHARLPTRVRALVTHPQGGWEREVPIENIGLGGARIVVDARVALGDPVTVSLMAPTLWDSLVLPARIAWVGPGEPSCAAGIAFEPTSAGAVLALCKFISTLGYE
jgi:PilZ domain-containing protein